MIDIRKKIKPATLFEDLTRELDPHKEKDTCSVVFLVDSSPDNKIKILLKYPGRKVANRNLKKARANSVHWDSLYDFLVVPIVAKKETSEKEFTYRKMLTDFDEHKKQDKPFWEAIIDLLEENVVSDKDFSYLKGIDPKVFLYVLKWMWVQEDLNYRFNHNDFACPTRYRLPTGKSLGRKKFFASLLIVRTPYYTAKECFKLFS